jgi:hypothetical protein
VSARSGAAAVPSAPEEPIARILRRQPAWLIAAVLAVVYLILAPQSPDLAAAGYRSDLFSRVGFSLWDNSWYGGHHLPAYSIVAPALGALIGPQPLAALSMVLATALFGLAVAGRFPDRATRLAAAWFAVGAGISLLSSRVPFDLGLAVGLGAVVLVQRGRFAWSCPASVLCSLSSPVAGAFLAMAMVAWMLAGSERLRAGTLAVLALAPIGLLVLLFPEGGSQPFVASAFYPALAGAIVVGLAVPAGQRVLRLGVALYALAMTASYVIPTAVGGNADRLGALAAGPVAALVLFATGDRRRSLALAVLALPLTYWQANAPVTDFVSTVANRGVQASYYRPLLGELAKLDVGYGRRPARIEVVPTVDHWEARYVAPAVMIARGWERQLDAYRNGLFYEHGGKSLTAVRYESWLREQAVSYVALPDAPLDYSAKAEAKLLAAPAVSGPGGFLREAWHSRHWRLYEVSDPAPLASPPASLTQAGTQSFTLQAPAAGSYRVVLHFTPYWAIARGRGCVVRGPGDWTTVKTPRAERVHVVISFSLGRILADGPRCR